MDGFSKITQFGTLTVKGKTLTFDDFDKDKNGKISEDEYNTVLKEMKLDSVELSTVDKNKDNTISKEEFSLWEQKIAMQDIVNGMSYTFSKDFSGKTEFLPALSDALRNYINEYAQNYIGDKSSMVDDFKEALPKQYEIIKKEVLADTPEVIIENTLETLTNTLVNTTTSSGETITETGAKNIAAKLKDVAETFAKNYSGNNLSNDLMEYLQNYLNQSDTEKLQDSANSLKEKMNSIEDLESNNGLEQLKEYARQFLMSAIKAGSTLEFGGYKLQTKTTVTKALDNFKSGSELKTALEELIANLSTIKLIDNLALEEKEKAEAEAEKAFTSLSGANFMVQASTINYTDIEGYASDTTITVKGKSGHEQNIKNAFKERIDNSSLKEQMKKQITDMLIEKGIKPSKIDNIFENVYNATMSETLGEVTSSKTNKKWLNKNKKYTSDQNVKTVVDNFINKFNTNIASAIDTMNASPYDMDTIDLDYTQAGKTESGEAIKDEATGTDVSQLYASGEVISTKKRGADYYTTLANQMIDNMKNQMLSKAKSMCKANGVKFDEKIFSTIFDNAKSTATNAGVCGIDAQGVSFGTTSAITSYAGYGVGTGIGAAISASASAGSILGPLGTAIGAAGGFVVGGLLGLIGSKQHSISYLNTRTLLDTFTKEFKTNYTNWIDKEKTKTA